LQESAARSVKAKANAEAQRSAKIAEKNKSKRERWPHVEVFPPLVWFG
jgi:hypothetical protein